VNYRSSIVRAIFGSILIIVSNLAIGLDIDDVQTQVFSPSCALSGCHNGTRSPNLSAGLSFSQIVNVSSSQSLDYIEPNNPDNSYLIRKIEGTGQQLAVTL